MLFRSPPPATRRPPPAGPPARSPVRPSSSCIPLRAPAARPAPHRPPLPNLLPWPGAGRHGRPADQWRRRLHGVGPDGHPAAAWPRRLRRLLGRLHHAVAGDALLPARSRLQPLEGRSVGKRGAGRRGDGSRRRFASPRRRTAARGAPLHEDLAAHADPPPPSLSVPRAQSSRIYHYIMVCTTFTVACAYLTMITGQSTSCSGVGAQHSCTAAVARRRRVAGSHLLSSVPSPNGTNSHVRR